MRNNTVPDSARSYTSEFRARVAIRSDPVHDPFSINPIRRSLVAVVGSLGIITLPFLVSEGTGTTVMLSVGWLAMAVLVFSLPVLIWATAEELVAALRRKVHPPISDLDLPQRIVHILQRHGVRTIRAAESLDEASLLLMSNLTPRDAQAVGRALSLWRYRRWQDAGFPAGGMD
jgi:hypothetical protein